MRKLSPNSPTPTVRKSVAWNLATGPVVLLANLVLIPFSIAICGANNYGIWVICFSTVSILGQVDFGLGTAIVRQLARYRSGGLLGEESVAKRYAIALFLLAAVGLAGAIVALLYGYFYATGGVASSPHLGTLIIFSSFSIFVTIVARCFISIIQSYGLFHPERILMIFGLILKTAILVVAAFYMKSVILVALADMVAVLVLGLGAILFAFRSSMLRRTASDGVDIRATRRELRQFGLPTFLSSFCSLLAMQLPLFFVGALVSFSDAAVFSALSRLLMSARASFGWITAPSLPDISSLGSTIGRSVLSKKVTKSVLLISALTSVFIGPLLVSGREFVTLWLGVDSQDAGLAIAAFALTIFLYGIYSPGVVFATALGHPGIVARQNVLVLIISLLASATLPRVFGLLGGALAVLLAIGIVFPWSILVTSRLTGMVWGSVLLFCGLGLLYSTLGAYIGKLLFNRLAVGQDGGLVGGAILSVAFVGLFYGLLTRRFFELIDKLV